MASHGAAQKQAVQWPELGKHDFIKTRKNGYQATCDGAPTQLGAVGGGVQRRSTVIISVIDERIITELPKVDAHFMRNVRLLILADIAKTQ